MKKKIWALILAAVALLAILFVPIPQGQCKDGGTKTFQAVTYKLVMWRRLTDDGIYEATRIYWIPLHDDSIDSLWELEKQNATYKFEATILEIHESAVLVEVAEGEKERYCSDKISFGTQELPDIGAQVGSRIVVYYTGEIMESYPAQVVAKKWSIAQD